MTLSESLSQMRALAKLWMSEGSVHQRELGGYLTVVCDEAERQPPSAEEALETLPSDEELERLTAPATPSDQYLYDGPGTESLPIGIAYPKKDKEPNHE